MSVHWCNPKYRIRPDFHLLTEMGYRVFYGSTIKLADLNTVGLLHTGALQVCSNLATVILRKTDAICQLEARDVLGGTKFSQQGGGGTLYVPQALIDDYLANEYWGRMFTSYYANNQILPIEGSPYERTT